MVNQKVDGMVLEYICPNLENKNKITIASFKATLNDLKVLPPTLVITDENDVLHDEREAYAHKLMQAGVDVTAVRYLGTIHDFLLLNPLKNSQATTSALDLASQKLRIAFSQ